MQRPRRKKVAVLALNKDVDALLAASVGPSILGKSHTLTQQVTAFAAAVRRKEKTPELMRQLSPFATGDFISIYSDLLAGKYIHGEMETLVPYKTALRLHTAETFEGSKEGLVFKAGDEGVGYYRDVGLQVRLPVKVSEHLWKGASRHARLWGAGGVPELREPPRRLRLKQERLLAAIAHISDERNLQLLAYGDHKLKLPNDEEIIVGAAHLRTCRAELYREFVRQCEGLGTDPADQKTYDDCCVALANGKTAKEGALDPTQVQTSVAFERLRTYITEVGNEVPSLTAHSAKLCEMLTLTENILLHELGKKMTSEDTDVAEHDIVHALADPAADVAADRRPVGGAHCSPHLRQGR